MAIVFEKTNFEGLFVIKNHSYKDDRGKYIKCYHKTSFLQNNIEFDFQESSDIISNKGVLRGLHYQKSLPQAKLIKVLQGKIFDVALDLRTESNTFGEVFTITLDSDCEMGVFIPAGFAHGFLTLEDNTIFSYLSSSEYDPSSSNGILWNDPKLKIEWPHIKNCKLIISEKDLELQTLSEYVESTKLT